MSLQVPRCENINTNKKQILLIFVFVFVLKTNICSSGVISKDIKERGYDRNFNEFASRSQGAKI